MITNTINLGIPIGLTSKIPLLAKENSVGKISAYIRYFLLVSSIVSIFITILLIIFHDFILVALIGNSQYSNIFLIILLSIPFLVLYSLVEGFLRGLSKISIIVRVTVITAIISTILLVPLIYYLNTFGVAIYILIFSSLPCLIFILKYRNDVKIYFQHFKLKLRKEEKYMIFKIGIVSLISSLFHQVALMILRKIIILNFGLFNNGLYQSVLALSINSFTLIYMVLTNYTLPKFSELKEKNEIVVELNSSLRFLLLILIPLVVIIFTYKQEIIRILYSQVFLEASNLLTFQLIGDIFRALAALFGLWLIPQMKIKELIIIDLVFNIVFLLLPFTLIELLNFNLNIIPFCYMLSFALHFSLYFIYSRSELSFKFSSLVSRNLLYSLTLVLITFLISIFIYDYSLYLNVFVIIFWYYLIIEKDERIKILNYFKKHAK